MKIYLVEYVDLSFVLNLKQNHEIVDNISDADIVITRNLKIDKSFIDQAKSLKCIAIHGIIDVKFNRTIRESIEIIKNLKKGMTL